MQLPDAAFYVNVAHVLPHSILDTCPYVNVQYLFKEMIIIKTVVHACAIGVWIHCSCHPNLSNVVVQNAIQKGVMSGTFSQEDRSSLEETLNEQQEAASHRSLTLRWCEMFLNAATGMDPTTDDIYYGNM